MKSAIALLALVATPALLTTTVVADIPVHCLHRQTVGVWNFKLGSNKNDDTLTCGHKLPDSVMTMVDNHVRYDTPNFDVDKEYKVTLSNPNIATDEEGHKGTWTMIYDEGFEVKINGRKFFTFFVYEPKINNPTPDENADFFSVCDETFSGWYHNDDEKDWGCYVGKQVSGGDDSKVDKAGTISSDHVVQPDSLLLEQHEEASSSMLRAGGSAATTTRRLAGASTGKRVVDARSTKEEQQHIIHHYDRQRREFDARQDDTRFVTDTAFIDIVNKDPLSTWTAKHYGEKFESLTHGDLRKMLGTPKYTSSVQNKDPYPSPSFIETHQSISPSEQEKMKKSLPKEFDWRHEPNIVTDIISQGSCGSCYAIAMVDALTMRLRVLTKGSDRTVLSPQNVVSCSDYNQGCEGGYPFLVGKFGEDIGFVPQYCEHYTAEDSACRVSI
jgi:cathepsin C